MMHLRIAKDFTVVIGFVLLAQCNASNQFINLVTQFTTNKFLSLDYPNHATIISAVAPSNINKMMVVTIWGFSPTGDHVHVLAVANLKQVAGQWQVDKVTDVSIAINGKASTEAVSESYKKQLATALKNPMQTEPRTQQPQPPQFEVDVALANVQRKLENTNLFVENMKWKVVGVRPIGANEFVFAADASLAGYVGASDSGKLTFNNVDLKKPIQYQTLLVLVTKGPDNLPAVGTEDVLIAIDGKFVPSEKAKLVDAASIFNGPISENIQSSLQALV